ncbi:hypothetical protein ACFQI3_06280 [Hansschlegelia quercus]|uniref:Pentapeptide MXKDX repeat protein n=1 Tax=Hansschlegelia quercus TaxID=2528245 RepID=A0A4V2JE45_9HYPH|nr:hypothetical protein [Hansschlegelia quercus]TBN53836.1 hypothetical protein EYR15_08560 [Hansschlegelia quercus]
MIFKSLRVAALAVAFVGSAVAAQAAETGMMDKPVVGQNTTTTSPDTGGPMQKAGATKHSSMMHKKTKKPKKRPMHHMKPMSENGDMQKTGGPGGKGEPKTGKTPM